MSSYTQAIDGSETQHTIAARALALPVENLLSGEVCASAETFLPPEQTIDYLCVEHFPVFIDAVRRCYPWEQDMLIAHYILCSLQVDIGKLFKVNQSSVSQWIRRGLKSMGDYLKAGSSKQERRDFGRAMAPQLGTTLEVKDPDCLGRFRVDVSEPGWEQRFRRHSYMRYATTDSNLGDL